MANTTLHRQHIIMKASGTKLFFGLFSEIHEQCSGLDKRMLCRKKMNAKLGWIKQNSFVNLVECQLLVHDLSRGSKSSESIDCSWTIFTSCDITKRMHY